MDLRNFREWVSIRGTEPEFLATFERPGAAAAAGTTIPSGTQISDESQDGRRASGGSPRTRSTDSEFLLANSKR